MNRRTFLELAAVGGAAGLTLKSGSAHASSPQTKADNYPAVLVDTTRCAGCRACEVACAESNGLPPPARPGDPAVFDERRTTATDVYAVVNRVGADQAGEPIYMKSQCMHCVSPACASACMLRALEKTPEGPVVYHKELCIGCRYCMVACPFGVPRFEYDSAAPFISKCQFCAQRQKDGQPPACVSVCPTEALQFGKRGDLIEEARRRIYGEPDRYVHRIYGEHEAGGTGWMYLSAVPFGQIGLPDLGTDPMPGHTTAFTSVVPLVLSLWPPMLMGLYAAVGRRDQEAGQAGDDE